MIPKQFQNLKFCRIRKGTKKPFEKDWTNKPYSYEEISKFKDENYGILCGYENLAVIDSDKEELQIAIKNVFPNTFRVKTPKGVHNYFFIPDLKQKIILEINDTHLGEVQSHGTQVIGPGSIHPSGKKYEILDDKPITTISCEQLLEFLKPFMKQIQETEEAIEYERKVSSEVDELSVANIWGTAGLTKHNEEYYGEHPIHGSEGGMNFWINPSKNLWHCFRCDSGGGPLSAIAVKEKIINCSEARKGSLRGSNARKALNAGKKYGLKDDYEERKIERELKIIAKRMGGEIKTGKKEVNLLWDNDLDNYEEEDKEWIIDKLIPNKSVCILTGKRGTLKTFIALLMGYSIAAGINFLGQFPTRKGGVIYLDKENGIPIMKKRKNMIKSGLEIGSEPLKVGFICFSELKIDKVSDISQIKKLIELHTPKLLIIDTYRRGISFDENDAGKVSELFVDILRPLAEQHNISILLIHHNRKGTGETADEMDEIRGSSDLANYVDIILKMERKSGKVILKQLKNRNAQEIEPIKIKNEFTESYIKLNYDGEASVQSQYEKCAESILIWINERGLTEFRTKEIKDMALDKGFKKNALHSALIELQSVGAIENIGFGVYKVHQNG